jgi:hypothetical protein
VDESLNLIDDEYKKKNDQESESFEGLIHILVLSPYILILFLMLNIYEILLSAQMNSFFKSFKIMLFDQI